MDITWLEPGFDLDALGREGVFIAPASASGPSGGTASYYVISWNGAIDAISTNMQLAIDLVTGDYGVRTKRESWGTWSTGGAGAVAIADVTGLQDILDAFDLADTGFDTRLDTLESQAVPAGGTIRQALVKASATNYDLTWASVAEIESGTWTPAATFFTPGDVTVSYVTQTGTYFKVGRLVFIFLWIKFTPTYTTASGTFIITGVPYATSDTNCGGPIVSHLSTLDYPAGRAFPMLYFATSSQLRMVAFGSGAAASSFTTTQLASGEEHQFIASFCYRTA